MQPSNIAGGNLLRVRLSAESRRLLNVDDLCDACSRGESSNVISDLIQKMKKSKEKENDSICQTDSFGRTALHYAAMKGRTSVVHLLLTNNFDADQDDMHGLYPLHLAIQCNNYDVAIELCSKTKPNLINYKKENAILILSKQRYHPKMEKLLSELIKYENDINLQDCRNCTPLFYAVDKPSFIKKLIENGANIHHKDGFGRNALFNAVYSTNTKVTKLLIESGSELEIKDDFCHTPLMLAACFGGIEIAELLINYGANINCTMQSNSWIMTPLSLAIRHENYDVAKLLVKNGADMDINVADNESIWDLFDQNYDFKYDEYVDDDEDNDVEMHGDDMELINIPDDMDLEIYSMGEAAKLNSNHRGSRSFLSRVEHKLKSKKRDLLLKYMVKIQTERKVQNMINTKLVKNLQIPMDVLQMIASPLFWH